MAAVAATLPPKETTVDIGFEVLIGWGEVPALNVGLPTALDRTLQSSLARTAVETDSYILSAGYRFGRIRLSTRFAMAHAAFDPNEVQDGRGSGAFGNTEIAVDLVAPAKEPKATVFLPKFALTLPTSSGMPLPPAAEVAANPSGNYGRDARDDYSTLLAANAARGFEENALFAPKRWGFRPSAGVRFHTGALTVMPFAGVGLLVSSATHPEHRVTGDALVGAEAGLPVAAVADFVLRVFADIALEKEERSNAVNAVAEPQLRLRFNTLAPYVGVLIPFLPVGHVATHTDAGAPALDPRFVAFRLGLNAAF
jgi:hypothetical protein